MTTTAVTGPAARAVHVWKVYGAGETEVVALRDVSVDLERGKFTAIMGPSGSGKSTLMHCLAGLDSVSRGEVYVGDTQVTGLGDAGLTRLRRDKIGFVFQQFNLLPTLTAEENILLPLSIAGRKPDPEWYRTVIETVRLGDRLGHRPTELSGGQQQRVACARALVGRPDVIFADEPTGNLDSRSGADVLTFLRDSVQTHGQTIVMVTHDPVAASYADRVLFLADGAVVDEILDPTADAVLDRMRTIDALDESVPGPTTVPVTGPAPESRGTTDPTGRTPHPGAADVGDAPGGPHRTGTGTGTGGGSAGPREPDDPTARAGAPTTDASRAAKVERAPTASATQTTTATLTAAEPTSVSPAGPAAVRGTVTQRSRPRKASVDTARPVRKAAKATPDQKRRKAEALDAAVKRRKSGRTAAGDDTPTTPPGTTETNRTTPTEPTSTGAATSATQRDVTAANAARPGTDEGTASTASRSAKPVKGTGRSRPKAATSSASAADPRKAGRTAGTVRPRPTAAESSANIAQTDRGPAASTTDAAQIDANGGSTHKATMPVHAAQIDETSAGTAEPTVRPDAARTDTNTTTTTTTEPTTPQDTARIDGTSASTTKTATPPDQSQTDGKTAGTAETTTPPSATRTERKTAGTTEATTPPDLSQADGTKAATDEATTTADAARDGADGAGAVGVARQSDAAAAADGAVGAGPSATSEPEGADVESASTGAVRSGEGERRAARRKPAGAAGSRPAASRPPAGKQRRRASAPKQPDDSPDEGRSAEPPATGDSPPRKAAKRQAKSTKDDTQPPAAG
ncbi:hypothetical protein GCM10009687_73970 [Asanoa iriomotensis]